MRLVARPLTSAAFRPYGDVLDADGPPDRLINDGRCGRYHDRARLDFGDGRAGISLFDGAPRPMPHVVDLVERHPEGSQAFLPLTGAPMLIVVAEDDGGRPAAFRAFLSGPGQGANLLRGIWHGVLCPVGGPGVYAVIDRIGPGPNLEEAQLDPPLTVALP